MNRLSILIAAAGVVLLAGCSPSTASDAGQATKQGYITLSPDNGGGAGASFCSMWRPQIPYCILTTTGACTSFDCPRDGSNPNNTTCAPSGAGTISAAVGTRSLLLAESPTNGLYAAAANAPGNWWTGGEAITLSATGLDGGVPAFTATLTAPARLTMAYANDGGRVSVTKGSALTVTWPAGIGTASLSFTGRWAGAFCFVDASTGTFVVPSAVTQALDPGPGIIQLANTQSTNLSVEDWSIGISASVSDIRVTNVE